MGKLTGLFSRGGTNTSDVIRQSTSMTMAYLLEQNRKFEAFMRDKVAELEGRVAAQQQTRLDYFGDDETASPEVVEDELHQENEQELEPTHPLLSLAADVDEPLGLSPAGFPVARFGPAGAAPVVAWEETVPVEPVAVAEVAQTEAAEPAQEPPSWLVMLGVAEPEPAGKEETRTTLDQDPAEMEPEDETVWSETTVWGDTTEDDLGEDPADQETEETVEATDENPAEEEREEELIGGEEMDGPEVGMPTGVYQDEAEPTNDLEDEQEEAGGTADQDEGEGEAELAGEKEVDWPEAEMPAGVDQDEAELEQGPDEGPAEEMDQGSADGTAAGGSAARIKVRKQRGALEVGLGTAIEDEEGEEEGDTLLPPWLTAKLQ